MNNGQKLHVYIFDCSIEGHSACQPLYVLTNIRTILYLKSLLLCLYESKCNKYLHIMLRA